MSRRYKMKEQSAEKIVFQRQARGADCIPPCIFLFLTILSSSVPAPPELIGVKVFCGCGCGVLFVIMYWASMEQVRITMDKDENAIVIKKRLPLVTRWKAASRIPFESLASHPYINHYRDEGHERFWVMVKRNDRQDDESEVMLVDTPSQYEAESWRACIEYFLHPV